MDFTMFKAGLATLVGQLPFPSKAHSAPEVMGLAAFRTAFPNNATADSEQQAEEGACADFAIVRGRLIETTELYVNVEGDHLEFYAISAAPFVVQILDTSGTDVCRWTDNEYLDPYWDVEVVDGRGIVPPAVIQKGWAYIYGRTHRLTVPADEIRS